jgi:hypothetical protein
MPEIPNAAIQVQPSGLLGLLGLKNRGKFPEFLDLNLVPAIELLDWYAQANASVSISATINAAVSALSGGSVFPEFLVPAGEAWLVHEYSVVFNSSGITAASAINQASVARMTDIGGGAGALNTTYTSDVVSVAAGQRVATRIDRMMLLRPGDQLGFLVGPVTTAALPVTGTATFVRCKL